MDGYNNSTDPTYQSTYSGSNDYIDILEPMDQSPQVQLYFPHPDWEATLGDNFTRDIRKLRDLSNFQGIEVWEASFLSDIGQSEVALEFDITNKEEAFAGEFEYTRLFIYHDNNLDGLKEYTEIENGDEYIFYYENANIEEQLYIIVGTDPSLIDNSRITVLSPNGNEIESLNNDFIIDLEYEMPDFIDELILYLEVEDCESGICSSEIYRGNPKETVVIETIDAEFRIHEGRILNGELAWGTEAGAGTMRKREKPIKLTGTYKLSWKDYSQVSSTSYGKFRYLFLEI